jgi:PAS domain S-box-containing protein
MQSINPNITKDELANQLIEAKDQLALLNDEKQLLENNLENLKFLTETINEVFWLFDWSNRKLIYVSPGYKKIYGSDPKELYKNPKKWISYIHPDDKEYVLSNYYEKVETGKYDIEFRVIRKDGKVHWVRDRAFIIKNDLNEVSRVAGLTEFITHKKEAEQEVLQIKSSLENILNTIPSGIIIVNDDLKIRYFNQMALELLKTSSSAIKKLTAIDFIHPDFRQSLLEYHNKRKSGFEVPDSHELKVVSYNGSWFWASIKLNDINYNGENCRILSINDVSNIKGYESSIKFYNEINKKILEANNLSTLIINKDYKIIGFNEFAVEFFKKISKNKLKDYADLKSYFNKKDYEKISHKLSEAKQFQVSTIELYPLNIGNRKFWLSFNIRSITEDNKLIGHVISIQDLTDFFAVKDKEEKNQAYFSSIVNSKKGLTVFALDTEYKYLEFNDPHKETMRIIWNVEIEKGKSILDYITHNKSKKKAKENFDRALSGEDFSVIEEFENSNFTKRTWENKYSPIYMKGRIIGVSVFANDITNLFENIEKLKDKVEELETLNNNKDKFISIIAHDLKAPMTGFIGLTKILKSEIEDVNPDLLSIAESISENAQSMFDLLENLLEWTRSNTGQKSINPDNINLHLITQGVFSLFNNNSKFKSIELINSIPIEYYAYADANMITTVIRNLISNSLKFTVKGLIEVSAKDDNNEIIVLVRDTGTGMSNEIREKLLSTESYTSRGTNNEKGTGLGLQLCREFIEKNGGRLEIESEVGKGSTFSFNLPKSS